jgi:hypothetical protein
MLVALVATLATASSASAASLVFVRAGDLFAVDGSGGQLRLIANGPEAFASPSVAGDGSVWAINGRSVVQVAANGAILRALALPLADAPVDLDLSPDGARLAVELQGTAAPGVYVVSTADGTVAPKSYPGLVRPAWLANGQLLVHRPATAPGGAAALVANVAAATDAQLWFADTTSLPTDGDVSADFTLGVWTNGGTGVVIRQLAGAPPAMPTGATCSFNLAAIGPVVQPNAHVIAFTSDDGIWLAPQPEPGACGDAVRIFNATEVRDVAWNPLDLAPGPPPLSADGKARLTGLALAAKSFPAATGTTLSGNATSAGTVTMTVIRLSPGLRKGRACVASAKKGKKLQRCTARSVVGAPVQLAVGAAGAFSLPVSRPDLTRGSYELAVALTDAIGRVSVVKRLPFKIP